MWYSNYTPCYFLITVLRSVRLCVCVCQPLFLRVLRGTHFNQAGEWCAVLEPPLNEDTPWTAVISGRDAFWTYLRWTHWLHWFPSAAVRCFHGCFSRFCTSHKPFMPRFAACHSPQTSEQIVQQFSCSDRFTLRFPHPFRRGVELTEKSMTKCVFLFLSRRWSCEAPRCSKVREHRGVPGRILSLLLKALLDRMGALSASPLFLQGISRLLRTIQGFEGCTFGRLQVSCTMVDVWMKKADQYHNGVWC